MQLGDASDGIIVSERSNRRGGDCRARRGIASADRHIVCTEFHPSRHWLVASRETQLAIPTAPAFQAGCGSGRAASIRRRLKAAGIAAVGVTDVASFPELRRSNGEVEVLRVANREGCDAD